MKAVFLFGVAVGGAVGFGGLSFAGEPSPVALSVTNYAGRVVSGTFVRTTRSHVFIRNADGVVRAVPYDALPAAARARVRALADPASATTGGTR